MCSSGLGLTVVVGAHRGVGADRSTSTCSSKRFGRPVELGRFGQDVDVSRPEPDEPWYAVRCVVGFDGNSGGEGLPFIHEERVTLWRAKDFAEAIERAEAEAREYAEDLDGKYIGLAQAFRLAVETVGHGDEIFSLMRRSDLAPSDYLNRFFSTGQEHQGLTH